MPGTSCTSPISSPDIYIYIYIYTASMQDAANIDKIRVKSAEFFFSQIVSILSIIIGHYPETKVKKNYHLSKSFKNVLVLIMISNNVIKKYDEKMKTKLLKLIHLFNNA